MAVSAIPPSFWDRARNWRNALVADRRFQRWAASFALTRPFARAKANELFELCAGFVYSQILLACVELDVFERLADGPLDLETLAKSSGLAPERAERLFDAASSLGLLTRLAPRGGGRWKPQLSASSGKGGQAGQLRYGLGELGAALRGNAGALAMIRHHKLLYADLQDPVALLRSHAPAGALAHYWSYANNAAPGQLSRDQTDEYSVLMAQSQHLVAEDLLDAYALARHENILDVGGGDGTFLRAVAERTTDARLTLFDLPTVAERAQERFAERQLTGRTRCVGGSFFDDPLPTGADLITLVRVLFDHDDTSAGKILSACAQASAPGTRLLVAEQMAGTRGAEAMGDAYFGFYLLAMGHGRARRAEHLTEMIEDAGFCDVKRVRTRRPLLASALVATRR
ncbi:MAG: methyltransferase [Pseudomonadota bacterium]